MPIMVNTIYDQGTLFSVVFHPINKIISLGLLYLVFNKASALLKAVKPITFKTALICNATP